MTVDKLVILKKYKMSYSKTKNLLSFNLINSPYCARVF